MPETLIPTMVSDDSRAKLTNIKISFFQIMVSGCCGVTKVAIDALEPRNGTSQPTSRLGSNPDHSQLWEHCLDRIEVTVLVYHDQVVDQCICRNEAVKGAPNGLAAPATGPVNLGGLLEIPSWQVWKILEGFEVIPRQGIGLLVLNALQYFHFDHCVDA